MISWLKRIVVYTLEHHSFDQLLGEFPGVDGLTPDLAVPAPDGRLVHPFPMSWYSAAQLANPNHSWEAVHAEWDHGSMTGFVRVNGWDCMGYYPLDRFPVWRALASQAHILDHYYASVLGPTLVNRLYLVSGTSDGMQDDPPLLSPRGFSMPTVFDQLTDVGIDWRYYVGNYRPGCAVLAKEELFCPLLWFPRFRRRPLQQHIQPWAAFFHDARQHTLPPVTFLAPPLATSGHPPFPIEGCLRSIQQVYDVLSRLPDWHDTLLVVNFDESGGFYDHVPPPIIDAYGLGMRVPCLLFSGRLGPGVNHETFDHTSVLRLIEEQFQLPRLGARTQVMASLASALGQQLVD